MNSIAAAARQELTRRQAAAELERRKSSQGSGNARPREGAPEKDIRKIADEGRRQIHRTARSLATGVAGLADLPNLPALGAYALGLREKPYFYEPISGRVQNAIDEMTEGKLKPKNKTEEWVDLIGETLGGFLAPGAIASKGASTAGKLISKESGKRIAQGIKNRDISQVAAPFKESAKRLPNTVLAPWERTPENIATALGASGAIKGYQDYVNPDSSVGEALLAGLAGGKLAKTVLRPSSITKYPYYEKLAKSTKFNPEKYEQAIESGLSPNLSMVSDSPTVKSAFHTLEKMPFAGTVINENIQKNLVKFRENLGHQEGIYEQFPAQIAKEGATGYKNRVNKIVKSREKVYGPELEEARLTGKMINIQPLMEEVNSIVGPLESKSSQAVAATLPAGQLKKQLEAALSESPAYSQYNHDYEMMKKANIPDAIIEKTLGRPSDFQPELPYNEFKKFKTHLQTVLNESPEGSLKRKEATELMKKMSEIEDSFTEGLSPESHKSHKQMKRFYKSYASEKSPTNMKQYVDDLLSKDVDDVAFKHLLTKGRGNYKYIDMIFNGTPKNERADISRTFLSKLAERDKQFNIVHLHTSFEKLPNSVQDSMLKGFTPNERKLFKKNVELVGNLKEDLQKYQNVSKTAPTKHFMELPLKLTAAGTSALTGNVFPLAGMLAAEWAIPKAISKLYLNENFLKKMNNALAKRTPESMKLLESSPVYKKLLQYEGASRQREEEKRDKKKQVRD